MKLHGGVPAANTKVKQKTQKNTKVYRRARGVGARGENEGGDEQKRRGDREKRERVGKEGGREREKGERERRERGGGGRERVGEEGRVRVGGCPARTGYVAE